MEIKEKLTKLKELYELRSKLKSNNLDVNQDLNNKIHDIEYSLLYSKFIPELEAYTTDFLAEIECELHLSLTKSMDGKVHIDYTPHISEAKGEDTIIELVNEKETNTSEVKEDNVDIESKSPVSHNKAEESQPTIIHSDVADNQSSIESVSLCYDNFSENGKILLSRKYEDIFRDCGKKINCLLHEMSCPQEKLFEYFTNTEEKLTELIPKQEKTRKDFNSYLEKYKKAALEIHNKTEDELLCGVFEIPYDEENWICQFTIAHNHPPYMYLEYQSLTNPKEMATYCWWNVNALDRPNKAVAYECNVTDETIRNYVRRAESRSRGVFREHISAYYPQLEHDVFTIDDIEKGEIAELFKLEHLHDVFENLRQKVYFLSFLLKYTICEGGKYVNEPSYYLIPYDLTFDSCLRKFTMMLSEGVLDDTILDLNAFDSDSYKKVAQEIAIKIYGCTPTDNEDELCYRRNKSDVIHDVCMAMEIKQVMHIDEIFEEYHKLPLVKPLKDVEQLRSYLLRANEYVEAFQDKSSRYTLKKWKVDTRSRREIMRSYIYNSKIPVYIHDLLDVVKKNYPDTTMDDISNLLSNDSAVKSVNNGYWIPRK